MLKYAVFTVMLPDLTPEEAVTALADAGYDGVEWRVTDVPAARKAEEPSFWGNNLCTLAATPAEAERAKKLAEGAGLEINGLGTYIDVGDLEAVKAAMQFAQICGAPQIRVKSGTSSETQPYPETFAAAQQFLQDIVPLSEHYGIRALIEIHHKTITPSAGLVHRLVSQFDPKHIGVLHDAGNMVHEGFEDYLMGLQLLGDHLAHVHVKNAAYHPPEGGKGVWCSDWAPMDNGVVDFDALFTALNQVNYDGWIAFEDFSKAYPGREALKHNLDFIKAVVDRTYNTPGA